MYGTFYSLIMTLGGEVYVDTKRADTGSEAARWISEQSFKQPNMIFLHSLNGHGRENMKALLPNSVGAPFVWENITVEILNDSEFKEEFHETSRRQRQLGIC